MSKTPIKVRFAAWVFQQREKKEIRMLDKIFGASWKTSILGYILGAAHIPVVMGPDGKINYLAIIQGIALMIFGRLAKDHNVTGGPTQ